MKKSFCFLLVLFNLISITLISQTKLSKVVMSNGGQSSSNDTYRVNLSIGQSVVAKTTTDNNAACIGFWYQVKGLANKPFKFEKYAYADQVILKPSRRIADLKIYPNPFFDKAQIEFELAEKGRTKLSLVDVQGKEIDILMDETMHEGKYKITYQSMPAMHGVYTLLLTTHKERLHQSCIILK